MEMLLMGACLSMFGLAVMCLAFGAATRDERPVESAGLEKHVRLEQAAAESYMRAPNAALLHSRTISTLVN